MALELVGGRERRRIALVDYDPSWAVRYRALRAPLAATLVGVARRIDHIGSTAVPGLAAKPILDVQVSVGDPGDESRFGPALERLGYGIRVREPGHRMFRSRELDVHIHLWQAGGADERRHLLFRDWLRHDANDRVRYEHVKRALVRREWEDMNAYASAKDQVIAEVMERAEMWARATGWRPG